MTVTYGDNSVQIVSAGDNGPSLEEAEACARRLLAAAPAPPAPAPAEPFGFALSSDSERLPEDL
ncbi:hypothetical protein ACKI1J_15650 [Streptomyces scabiei]|uniref:hypothetical protein n=1 Tax=Streptomyces scabiei TaxID=1930 RepID=UPI0038F8D114